LVTFLNLTISAFAQERGELSFTNPEYKKSAGGKIIAPVIDIFPQIAGGNYSRKRISEEISLFKSLGFERIYFVVANPGYPSFSSPNLSVMPPGRPWTNNAYQSVMRLGDVNFAYLYETKKQGLEAWAIYKPYECGTAQTIPENRSAPSSLSQVKTIGGSSIYLDNLLSENPALRVKRRPVPDSIAGRMSLPVERFELAFRL